MIDESAESITGQATGYREQVIEKIGFQSAISVPSEGKFLGFANRRFNLMKEIQQPVYPFSLIQAPCQVQAVPCNLSPVLF
jgi:hypothetical protein